MYLQGEDRLFGDAVRTRTVPTPLSLVVGDFDDDGILDVAAVSADRAVVAVHLGQGDGTFDCCSYIDVPDAPGSLVVGDFTGDEALDPDFGVLAPRNLRDSRSRRAGVWRGSGAWRGFRPGLRRVLAVRSPDSVKAVERLEGRELSTCFEVRGCRAGKHQCYDPVEEESIVVGGFSGV